MGEDLGTHTVSPLAATLEPYATVVCNSPMLQLDPIVAPNLTPATLHEVPGRFQKFFMGISGVASGYDGEVKPFACDLTSLHHTILYPKSYTLVLFCLIALNDGPSFDFEVPIRFIRLSKPLIIHLFV